MGLNMEIIVLMVAAVLFVGCLSPTSKVLAATGEDNVGVKEGAEESNPALVISAKSPLEIAIEKRLQGAEELKKRQTDLPEIFFRNLPSFPEDFYRVRVLVLYSKISDLDILGEEYWKQPEFLPGFEETAVEIIKNPQTGRWGAFGFGVYPGDTRVTASPGSEFEVTTFIHSSWLVETYQGIKFAPEYMETITLPYQDLQGSQVVTQNPEEVRKYFEVSISPEMTVLEPSFPILEYSWIQKMKVRVKVNPETPPGTYVIGVNTGVPDSEFNDKMMMKYLNMYTTGGSNVGVGRSLYQIAVIVK
ncbi:MAG: hypothetical protein ABIG39_06305 [Candidatus Micrarchaeota archaeon]